MANAGIVCWNCKAFAVTDDSECPQCKAGLSPEGRGLTKQQFFQEQLSLRVQAGIGDSELTIDDLTTEWHSTPVVRPNGAVEITAKVVAGLGLDPKTNLTIWFGDDQIYLVLGTNVAASGIWDSPPAVRHQIHRAADVGYVRVESAGTKSNIGALALFGILALGAKRDWSALSMDLTDSELVVLVREPVYGLRSTLSRAIDVCPSLQGKITEGAPPPQSNNVARSAEATAPHSGVIDELERLAALYEKGLIDDQEFQDLKAALIRNAQGESESEEP